MEDEHLPATRHSLAGGLGPISGGKVSLDLQRTVGSPQKGATEGISSTWTVISLGKPTY